ncbi:MAG: response regulator [Nitrospirota bacterium]
MQEKRVFKRAPYTDNVLLNGSILVKGIDISEGGLYVHTGRKFAIGDIIRISFRLAAADINLAAQVMTCQESIGMGLQFLEMSPYARKAVLDYIAVSGEKTKTVVLIVEDNETSRRLNKSKLIMDGFGVMEAANGLEALKALQNSAPDIIVLDLYMEGMDGFKVLSFMRADERYKNIPVLVLSARGDKAEIEKAMALGATSFMVKMLTSPVKLSEAVKKMIATVKRG